MSLSEQLVSTGIPGGTCEFDLPAYHWWLHQEPDARRSDLVVTGGENVYSTEVEQALCKHPAVNQAAVVGIPDERWGEKVTAMVILSAGQSATEEELIAHCRTLIAGYKVPKTIRFLPSFPMTPSGKVLKRDLRAQFSESASN